MTRFQKGVIKATIPIVVLTVVMAIIANAVGGWFKTLGPLVIVMGTGMILGRGLRGKLEREEGNGN